MDDDQQLFVITKRVKEASLFSLRECGHVRDFDVSCVC
jgi:hypothetical protein